MKKIELTAREIDHLSLELARRIDRRQAILDDPEAEVMGANIEAIAKKLQMEKSILAKMKDEVERREVGTEILRRLDILLVLEKRAAQRETDLKSLIGNWRQGRGYPDETEGLREAADDLQSLLSDDAILKAAGLEPYEISEQMAAAAKRALERAEVK